MMKKRLYFILIVLVIILYGCTNQIVPDNEVIMEEDNNVEITNKKDSEINHIDNREDCPDQLTFNSPPVNLDKVGWIVPLGAMSGNHVTPTDHQYYQAAHNNLIEVISPGDGTVILIERMVEGRDDDWRIIIRHKCNIESIYIHIDKLSDKLTQYIPVGKRVSSPQVSVKEGEILGWYDQNVDYNVVDYNLEIGLLNKESFSVAEPWKIHVQDPFLYFNQEIQNKMIALSQRSQEPFGGKIDYDIDATLIGMWFEEGTNGYAGKEFPSEDYHKGHLAIVPNHIDPTYTMVSVGTYKGEVKGYQFGVGNIDASEISIGQKIEWELYNFEYRLDGVIQNPWGVLKGSKVVNGFKVGEVSIELIENRKLKVDFGDGIKYYVR